MAEQIQMPKLGNSVESCIIVEWMVKPGDTVKEGDILCVAETDKAAVDVESKHEGVILALLAEEGDEVPVYAPIAAVGEEGESFDAGSLESGAAGGAGDAPEKAETSSAAAADESAEKVKLPEAAGGASTSTSAPAPSAGNGVRGVSPRARNLAAKKYVDPSALSGSGPGGRIIERDVEKAAASGVSVSPAAAQMAAESTLAVPESGSGIGGRVLTSDLTKKTEETWEIKEIPVKGVRKLIAEAMHKSLSTTAQFTAHASADASKLLDLRKRFKSGGEAMGLSGITVNDLVIFAVVKTLKNFPDLNAHFTGDTIRQFPFVHMGIAVDTARGLLVPVLRNADSLSLKGISDEAKKIYSAINSNTITPDDLSGSTFTVTNLGSLGIECFTPVLNVPEVAILGICSIEQKPVLKEGEVVFRPHIGLSLTVNHQVIDGAPAARFLKALGENIANIDLLLSL